MGYCPKFGFESEFSLSSVLRQLGMKAAFDGQMADFSGIDGTRELSISDVIHKAFVSVDEKGTEAAAATLIGIPTSADNPYPPRLVIQIDHPFVFMIRENVSGTILFMGKIVDPGFE